MAKHGVQVHGWIFDVSNGLVTPFVETPDIVETEYQVVSDQSSLE